VKRKKEEIKEKEKEIQEYQELLDKQQIEVHLFFSSRKVILVFQ